MRIRKPRRQAWNLSCASMSDIAFLLIIFFAVAGKFTRTTEDIELPGVDLGEPSPRRDIEVVVTKEGAFLVNGNRVEPEALKEEIAFYIMEDTGRDERTVVVQADRDAAYGTVATAIEAINQADAYLELAVRHRE